MTLLSQIAENWSAQDAPEAGRNAITEAVIRALLDTPWNLPHSSGAMEGACKATIRKFVLEGEGLDRCREERGEWEEWVYKQGLRLDGVIPLLNMTNSQRIEAAISRLADAERRLRFYADEANWMPDKPLNHSQSERDEGQLAREYFDGA